MAKDIWDSISSKIERGLRNKTGVNFTHAEVRAIVGSPIYMELLKAGWEELKAEHGLIDADFHEPSGS